MYLDNPRYGVDNADTQVPCPPSSLVTSSGHVFRTQAGDTLAGAELWSESLDRCRQESKYSIAIAPCHRSVTDYCCLNSTYLEVKGHGCFSAWRDVARYTETRGACTWTGWRSLDIYISITIYNYLGGASTRVRGSCGACHVCAACRGGTAW